MEVIIPQWSPLMCNSLFLCRDWKKKSGNKRRKDWTVLFFFKHSNYMRYRPVLPILSLNTLSIKTLKFLNDWSHKSAANAWPTKLTPFDFSSNLFTDLSPRDTNNPDLWDPLYHNSPGFIHSLPTLYHLLFVMPALTPAVLFTFNCPAVQHFCTHYLLPNTPAVVLWPTSAFVCLSSCACVCVCMCLNTAFGLSFCVKQAVIRSSDYLNWLQVGLWESSCWSLFTLV